MPKSKTKKKNIRKAPRGARRAANARDYAVKIGGEVVYKTDDYLLYMNFVDAIRSTIESFGVKYSTLATEENGQGVYIITIREAAGV